jgi:hypothetical protein
MGMRRAHHHGMRNLLEMEVGGVLPLPRDETMILSPAGRHTGISA